MSSATLEIDALTDAAAGYLARGFKVLPLCGKSPRVAEWQRREFTREEITKMLAVYHDPAIGVQMGPASGVVDIEWDSEPQRAAALALFDGEWPDGPEFKSRKGGHKLFAWDDRLEATRAGDVSISCGDGDKLKIRIGAGGKGSQSAFPPSPNKQWLNGKSLDDLPLPRLPDSVIAKLIEAAGDRGAPAACVQWSGHEFDDRTIEDCRRALAELPDAVEGNYGHDRMFRAACEVCRRIGNEQQALDLLNWFNAEKCLPPFDAGEVIRKLAEASRHAPPRASAFDEFEPVADGAATTGARRRSPFAFFTSAELEAADLKVEFLIDQCLVAGQPMFVAGPSKSLKTSVLLDAAIALACGGKFLDTFQVTRPCGVVVMSGESGLPVLRDTAMAQCRRRGIQLRDLDRLYWSADLPRFGNAEHAAAVQAAIAEFKADVLIVDPMYLALPGDDAANAQIQGQLLQSLNAVCVKLGVVLVVAAHTKKLDHCQPIGLNEIAYSAGPQFAGQWWLLNRRERYAEGSGQHKLWLSVGGRAKFSGVYGVDVAERPGDELAAAEWNVTTFPADDAKRTDREQRDYATAAADAARIRSWFLQNDNAPASRTTIGRRALGSTTRRRIDAAIDYLTIADELETCQCTDATGRTKSYPGFRLKDSGTGSAVPVAVGTATDAPQ